LKNVFQSRCAEGGFAVVGFGDVVCCEEGGGELVVETERIIVREGLVKET
jgi:hypothetical protein